MAKGFPVQIYIYIFFCLVNGLIYKFIIIIIIMNINLRHTVWKIIVNILSRRMTKKKRRFEVATFSDMTTFPKSWKIHSKVISDRIASTSLLMVACFFLAADEQNYSSGERQEKKNKKTNASPLSPKRPK